MYFKYNNHNQDKKLVLDEQKIGCDGNPIKAWEFIQPTQVLFQHCFTLTCTFNLFPRASNSFEKLGKFPTKYKKVAKHPCAFFLTIVLKT